jgi:hypothetical protein
MIFIIILVFYFRWLQFWDGRTSEAKPLGSLHSQFQTKLTCEILEGNVNTYVLHVFLMCFFSNIYLTHSHTSP